MYTWGAADAALSKGPIAYELRSWIRMDCNTAQHNVAPEVFLHAEYHIQHIMCVLCMYHVCVISVLCTQPHHTLSTLDPEPWQCI